MSNDRSGNARWFWWIVVVLAVVHYDFWYWDDATLLFGFLPVGLAFHAVFSLVAAAVWALATRVIWPAHLEEWADEPLEEGGR